MNKEEIVNRLYDLSNLINYHKNSVTRDENGLYYPFDLVEYMLEDIKGAVQFLAQDVENAFEKSCHQNIPNYRAGNSAKVNHLGETKHPGIINIPDELKGKKQSWPFSEKPGFAIHNVGETSYEVEIKPSDPRVGS